MAAKVFEAKEHCKAAEKALKTGVFRWKADYDSAADEYSQAAQCYRIARDLPNSKECHLKASECFKKNNAFFHAAKALENAMIVCKEIASPEEIYNLASESATLYQQHGSGDSGASVLDKGAKILEGTSPELAVKLFQQAADVSSWPEPKKTEAPEITEAPMDTEASEDAEASVAPEVMEALEVTEAPRATEASYDTEALGALGALEVTEAPMATEASDDKEAPVASGPPGVMDAPQVTEAPMATEALEDKEAPMVTGALDATLAAPISTEVPIAMEALEEPADVKFVAQETQTESSQHQGSEYISKASRILVKLQWYDQAVDSLRREIGFHQESGNTGAIGRLTVAIVLVQLARGDTVAAEKAYKEWGSNCEVAEMQTLEQILQAYDEEDRESAKRALASSFIRNMDVEYARLAATVPLPEAMEPAPRAAVRENAAPSYVSPNAQSTTTADVSIEETDESPYAPVTYVKKSEDEDDLC